MNCGTFDTTIFDLARNQAVDAAARDRALAHIEICARCRARLENERALAAGLKALAAADDAKSAPHAVEAVLLAAFRRQTDAPMMPAAAAMPAGSAARLKGPSWRWAWAVAATLLLAAAVWAYRATRVPVADEQRAVANEQVPQPLPSLMPPAPREDPPPKFAPQQPPRAMLATLRKARIPRTVPFIRDSITSYAGDYEETTEFVSVSYEDSQTPIESGQVIRVRMPRSALARFGLPVNLEQADVPVKADVLVGEDGLARAIRFVR